VGSAGLFLIVIAFLFLYFVLVRPQKRRQVDQQRMLNELKVGDEVVTAGGIYGEVTGLVEEGGDLLVRIAPELEVRVARRAIAGVTPEPDEDEPAAELERPEEPDPPAPTPGT
jgi:preprotein translocase subunit YajC